MGVDIGENKLTITARHKTFHFDLPKDAGNNLKHKIDSIMKHYEFVALHKIENEVMQLLSKYKHGDEIHKHRKQ